MRHVRGKTIEIGRTMATKIEVDDIADTNVDDAEETLVPLLKLPLVKDLYSNHRGVLDVAERRELAGNF